MRTETQKTKDGETAAFSGWYQAAVGFVLYGVGLAPAYYSWGYLAPEMIAELGLSRAHIGQVFGAFTLVYTCLGPAVGAVILRFGLRATVTVGALIAALGFALLARATSVVEVYLTFGVLGAIGIGLSTALPAQTLAVNWFSVYQARAIAIVLIGGALVGAVVPALDELILRQATWRDVWNLVALNSVAMALVAAFLLRSHPERYGQHPDGRPPATSLSESSKPSTEAPAITGDWTLREIYRTPQFALAMLALVINLLPWRVLSAHGRLLFDDMGFAPTVVAALLGLRVGSSAVGRLSGSLADFLLPPRVMSLAMLLTAAGLWGLASASSVTVAYLSVAILGLSYGIAYTSGSVLIAYLFGRRVYAQALGVIMVAMGSVGALGPSWAGRVADQTGSYQSSIWAMVVLSILGAVAIFRCRPLTRSSLQS